MRRLLEIDETCLETEREAARNDRRNLGADRGYEFASRLTLRDRHRGVGNEDCLFIDKSPDLPGDPTVSERYPTARRHWDGSTDAHERNSVQSSSFQKKR